MTEHDSEQPEPHPSEARGDRPNAENGASSEGASGTASATMGGDPEGAAETKDDADAKVPVPKASARELPPPSRRNGASKRARPADVTATEGAPAPLVARGNPLRLARGGLVAGGAALLAFLLMAHDGQLSFGVPLGFLLIAVASFGVMDLLGTFDDQARVVGATTGKPLALVGPPVGRAVSGLVLFGATLYGGQCGWGVQWVWGIAVTAAFLFWTVTVFQLGVALGPWAVDEAGLERPLLQRHGFWVVALGAALYLPTLGLYSLWDPWETHYGEVAREILSRDDWISLWWAQDGWFWSKPILNFWMQSIAMATLHTHYQPGQMLLGIGGATAHPEWVVRAPNVVLALLAMYLLYKGVAKVFGRRAGLLGALVLATMPDWYFLAHQTMTDMPFVAAMTAAMGLLLLGLHTDEEVRAKVYRVQVGARTYGLTAWHLVFGAVLLCALPQILYLLSRNLELVLHGPGAHGLRLHFDEFRSGSAGNCGIPGNEACSPTLPASIPKSVGAQVEGVGPFFVRLFGAFEPVVQALMWTATLVGLLYVNWGERRMRRLYYVAAWLLAAIATMGKGPAGFALPMICAFAYVCTKKRWSELLKFELVSGALVILGVALPWYVAMYVRHGSPFTDRLIFHDMFNRAFHHVHDTNEGDDTSFRFYIWQLGYALFPWTGLAPLGLVFWLRRGDSADRGRGDVSVFLFMWFLFAFALFSFMGTKFHHYIFPAVPAVAMLIGIVLDRLLGESAATTSSAPEIVVDEARLDLVGLAIKVLPIAAGIVLVLVGTVFCFPGALLGAKGLHSEDAPPRFVLGGILALVGAVTLALAARRDQAVVGPLEKVDPSVSPRAYHEAAMLSAAALAGGLVLLLVGRDLVLKPEGADQPGAIRFLQLFTYNYRRAWPETLDFSAGLIAFTALGIALSFVLAARAWRRWGVLAFCTFACVSAVYGLDVYMVETAPHWGQHEVIEAYYANRASENEPLVAYQMNWKGENFYTGNRVPAFVSSGSTFTTWLKQQRDKGVHVMYFVTEHARVGGLKNEVAGKDYRELTDRALNNKFVLVRAEL